MKKTTYLFVAMLMAFTMVGCQVDLSDYLTKEEADAKYATIAYVDGKVADLETKINDIDAKFANYYTKVEVDEKGFVTKEELGTLEFISKAVKEYLDTVKWEDYIGDGYTKEEIDAKLKAITAITDKLEETYATLEKLNELSTKVTSLETTVTTLGGKVTTLENKPAPSGNGGDGYCGLSADEVTNIKTLLTQWANNNISGVVYSLTGYVKESDLADYVKTENLPSLEGYAKKIDIKDFTSDIATLTNRISKVENLLTVDGTFGQKLAELETKVNNTNATEVTELKTTVDTIKAWYETNKDKVTNLNLAAYLTVANAENTYATKSSVETVASNLAELTSRVDTLETILEIENNTSKIINELKLAVKGADGDKNLVAELNNALNELKGKVENHTETIEKKLTDEDSDIKKLEQKVDSLNATISGYGTFTTDIETALAKISSIEETLENKADSFDKKYIVDLIKDSFIEKAEKATFATTTDLENYQTKGDYLTSESQIIENITSRLATLESDKTKVELCPNMYKEGGDRYNLTYLYYPYIKFTDNNGKVSYMTFFDYGYREDDPVQIESFEGNLDFNGTIKEGRKFNHYAINFVDSILNKYLPKTNN